jgi:integrase
VANRKVEAGKGPNPVTVNRRLTVIKHIFKKAVEWDLLKSTRQLFDSGEIKVLLKECERQMTSPWLLPLVTLALNTGMREGELLKLKW